MKNKLSILVLILTLVATTAAFAVDIDSLDKVSILMPKPEVLSILGEPDETVTHASGLRVKVYKVKDAFPLSHFGSIFQDGFLIGQSFVFHGRSADEITDRLQKHGFVPMLPRTGPQRFTGLDDDTGRPLVAVIEEGEHMSTITTFEKQFYKAQVE